MTHTHECPDCKKIIPHDGEDCEKFLAEFFAKFACLKMREKQAQAAIGTCFHCGQVELAAEMMATLSDGSPSNMCLDCEGELRAADAEYKATAHTRWLAQVQVEEARATQAEAWKRMSKTERKAAMAGKSTGNLF